MKTEPAYDKGCLSTPKALLCLKMLKQCTKHAKTLCSIVVASGLCREAEML